MNTNDYIINDVGEGVTIERFLKIHHRNEVLNPIDIQIANQIYNHPRGESDVKNMWPGLSKHDKAIELEIWRIDHSSEVVVIVKDGVIRVHELPDKYTLENRSKETYTVEQIYELINKL